MRVLKSSDYKQSLWKNGGGRTDELLVHPHADGAFLWRLSIATIATSGPFSIFPGIDRIIMTLGGPVVHLDFADGRTQELARCVPFSFAGEEDIYGRLASEAGAATDFNVMTRRDECKAALSYEQLQSGAKLQFDPAGGWLFAYIISGSLRMGEGDLGAAQSVLLEPQDRMVEMLAISDCELAVTRMSKI